MLIYLVETKTERKGEGAEGLGQPRVQDHTTIEDIDGRREVGIPITEVRPGEGEYKPDNVIR